MRLAVTSLVLIVSVPSLTPAAWSQEPVRIGMIRSLFEEKDERQVRAQTQPFAEMIKKQTGVDGDFVVVADAAAMARELKEGKLGLGVLHGVEFAWLKQQCPDCRPLIAAINETDRPKAVVLVRADREGKSAADLKGETVAQARRSPQHVRFFLERAIGGGQSYKPLMVESTDAAIEAVVSGKAAATAVSNVACDVYREQKPGRFKRLRVLEESPVFPAAVVVYRPGQGRETDRARFREALLKATDSAEGRQTMTLWRLTGFQDVPADYDQMVQSILERYPK